MGKYVKKLVRDSLDVKTALYEDEALLQLICDAADMMIMALKSGHKILLCGNGGSAADAQHIAAELSGRYLMDRPALAAESLTVNSSALTAIGNDFGYEQVFSRQLEAMGNEGDVLIGISTSGNSKNVVLAFEKAKGMNIQCISLTGSGGGALKNLADIALCVPSDHTPRIQECHILIGHILCELCELKIFDPK